jgi:putative transposase
MPRVPRPVVPGQPLHLIQRGNNRAASFVGIADFQRYKQILREASDRTGCAIHAYVLMTNHVHLLVTPDCEKGPARMMQSVGRRYVRYFNDRYARTGTLWEGRYRSAVVDSQHYFLACSRYIELNPARAGIVAQPAEYPWSSFRCSAHGRADALITPHPLYLALGANPTRRQGSYRALFVGREDVEAVDAIRRATNAGTTLGSARYRAELEMALQRRLTRALHGGDRRSASFRATSVSTTLTP